LSFHPLSHLQSIRHWALGIGHQEDHFFFAFSAFPAFIARLAIPAFFNAMDAMTHFALSR
jgi:hypothetical protein